jgi:hypothetical protein
MAMMFQGSKVFFGFVQFSRFLSLSLGSTYERNEIKKLNIFPAKNIKKLAFNVLKNWSFISFLICNRVSLVIQVSILFP